MSDFDNIGKLKHLLLKEIEPSEKISESEFIVTAAAEAILQANGRNWIPAIVQEIADYKYQIVSNQLVYAAAQKAGLDRVWCIVISPESQNIEQAKILAREAIPKINLTTASRDIILAALRYLIAEPASALKGVDPVIATDKIAAADRESWSNLNPITTLKCGITKGKKLDHLSKIFFVSPPISTSQPLPPPESISIKIATRDEIFSRLDYLSQNKIDGFDKVDIETAADIICSASKGKWKSLNPISKLECGLNTTKIKTLKKVFSL
ncbi:hypothetical protein H6G06_16410 [Anabaena sphaerica FACHB-251]|uniref:Uncharacterized protein n=1 Tax=Anabaena sphaerica FACHB-251 TaxID=2692883 RepID=A0A926WI73_9NOST|nr:hypothetical protein [Anabaena sphaerica]MBD2295021.1 hypothetical protein [Anabaena sphaerica FACHB-251]